MVAEWGVFGVHTSNEEITQVTNHRVRIGSLAVVLEGVEGWR